MKVRARHTLSGVALLTVGILSFGAGLTAARQESLEGHLYQNQAESTQLRILFDGLHRDANVDIGEITFEPGTSVGEHPHGATEIFYVLEGALEHVVNDGSTILEPGMLGFVQPPDLVQHITDPGDPPTRALVIWTPAGEAGRITQRWTRLE